MAAYFEGIKFEHLPMPGEEVAIKGKKIGQVTDISHSDEGGYRSAVVTIQNPSSGEKWVMRLMPNSGDRTFEAISVDHSVTSRALEVREARLSWLDEEGGLDEKTLKAMEKKMKLMGKSMGGPYAAGPSPAPHTLLGKPVKYTAKDWDTAAKPATYDGPVVEFPDIETTWWVEDPKGEMHLMRLLSAAEQSEVLTGQDRDAVMMAFMNMTVLGTAAAMTMEAYKAQELYWKSILVLQKLGIVKEVFEDATT